ncbi:MAG: ABC transporter permease [Ruminococcus sp.]|nr:ABC transporter permease [Ruminococcus sp.]MDE7226549.1 ABC transporter permease [Ruminococcus sp.]
MKFFNLLKKELSELINAQTILSLAIVIVMFAFLGNIMDSTVEKAVKQEYTVTIADNDRTDLTAELLENIKQKGGNVNLINAGGNNYSEILRSSGKESMIIIPAGFTQSLENGEAPELVSIAEMKSAAMMSNMSNNNDGAISFIKSCISDIFAGKSGVSEEDIKLINSPVNISEYTVVKDKSADVSAGDVMSKIMMQNMILPIIVFLLITMTSQMLMSAIANEKIDKTLETLLSAPVSRISILGAKMLSAGIVALLNAVAFMVGFSFMMNSAIGTATADMSNTPISEFMPVEDALERLGLSLGAGDYVIVGIQLFATIMICLSVSLILGSLVNDTKQAQTMIMPLMFMAMIPYMISMFADINSLPIVVRLIVYAIPFTHTFSAIPNIMFGNTTILIIGLIYQIIVFAVCMFLAVKLFQSDKILTANLNFRKSKSKKNN